MNNERKKILKRIKGELVHGDIIKIAEKVKRTREYVGYCLNPRNETYREDIVAAAIELIEERREKESQQLETLNE